MNNSRPLVNASKIYRGSFNYLVDGILKTYTYERKSGVWIKKFEDDLIKRHGKDNVRGYTAVEDFSTPTLSAPSIFSNKVDLNIAFKKHLKSFL